MVFWFTDPQGVIGRYYAKALGESEDVANAIEQQYWPKYSGALLPKTDVAVSVALAEKFDTFVGMFGIGQKPTGTQDPFAWRKSAIGTLRMWKDTNTYWYSFKKNIDIPVSSLRRLIAIKNRLMTHHTSAQSSWFHNKHQQCQYNIWKPHLISLRALCYCTCAHRFCATSTTFAVFMFFSGTNTCQHNYIRFEKHISSVPVMSFSVEPSKGRSLGE